MEFNYTVTTTPEDTVKRMMQAGQMTYPTWVTTSIFGITIFSIVFLSFVLSLAMGAIAKLYLNQLQSSFVYLAAVIIAVVMTTNIVSPFCNRFFTRFMRFETDQEMHCHYQIDASGIFIDEGDRQTTIKWSAISGVFPTRDFIFFHCRGLNYFIPKSRIESEAKQAEFLKTCQAWQKQAKGVDIAKVFT